MCKIVYSGTQTKKKEHVKLQGKTAKYTVFFRESKNIFKPKRESLKRDEFGAINTE